MLPILPSIFSVRTPTPAFICLDPWKRPKLRSPWDLVLSCRLAIATIQCSVTNAATRRPIMIQLMKKVPKTTAFVFKDMVAAQGSPVGYCIAEVAGMRDSFVLGRKVILL